MHRRRALGLAGGLGQTAVLAAYGSGSGDVNPGGATTTPSGKSGSATSSGSTGVSTEIPEETGGPFPADGSNGVNVLTESGIVRSDIRTSFGTGTATATGVPLTVKLKVLDVSNGGAAYPGRWPHIHFEVYPSLANATSAGDKLRTSQLALPEDSSRLVYATDGYGTSVGNLARTSLSTDDVLSDGHSLQLATVSGSVQDGMVATLTVPV